MLDSVLCLFVTLFEVLWNKRPILPTNPFVIVPLDYAMGQDGHISNMSRAGLTKAAYYARRFPHAKIAYANSAHCFKEEGSDSSGVIAAEKRALLNNVLEIPLERILDVGGITNSVVEARKICAALVTAGVNPIEVLIITGPQHARAAHYVWGKALKEVGMRTRVSLDYFDGPEWQKNHVFGSQRTGWGWAIANIKRQAALRVFGLNFVAKYGQHKPGK